MSISIFNKFVHHASGGEKYYFCPSLPQPYNTFNAATTDAPSDAHTSIITSDGKPPHIPAMPIVTRKPDLGVKQDAAIMMNMALILPSSVASDTVVESTA